MRHQGADTQEAVIVKVYIHSSVMGQSRDELEGLLDDIKCEVVEALEDLDAGDEAGEGSSMPAEAGTERHEVDEGDEGTEAPPLAPVCVVVLTPGLTEAELEPELTEVVKRGCRVVGVWGSGADGNASSLADYGADTVPWERDRVRDAICGVPQHRGPSGARMPKPKGTHGGC
ncbi:hypothetical protein [Sphingomonas sp. Ag1]|jgi:hypothetical protein|uniref:hypothetical protein n=1 Tax=Sphingomonas sp. Ag1 TaxID=1642949 RepID=UPI0006215CA4|nr:hypothetical protein [Sphingomonas sp. Ag1]KKI17909.1 hypothetical protein XM50_16995 [Sphingomonas sp. Ag1]